MGIVVFICLLTGPHVRWVKRFLPNTANRLVFVVIVVGMLMAWIVRGFDLEKHSDWGAQTSPSS